MKTVEVRKRLIGEDYFVDEGAIVILDRAAPTLIGFLRLRYLDDPDCLEGDIDHLFKTDGEGLSEEDGWREM
jgi:hypothetical protein